MVSFPTSSSKCFLHNLQSHHCNMQNWQIRSQKVIKNQSVSMRNSECAATWRCHAFEHQRRYSSDIRIVYLIIPTYGIVLYKRWIAQITGVTVQTEQTERREVRKAHCSEHWYMNTRLASYTLNMPKCHRTHHTCHNDNTSSHTLYTCHDTCTSH